MKKQIIFIANNYQGGIATYNKRLVETINKNNFANFNATNKIYNRYPPKYAKSKITLTTKDNKICSYKKIIGIINNDANCVIGCSNSIELEALNYYKYKGKIIYFLHGEYPYYFNTAVNFESIVDGFACVSELIEKKLVSYLPHRKDCIKTVKTILPDIKSDLPPRKEGIIFVGRAETAKGFEYLSPFYTALKTKGYNIPFSIYCQEKTNLSRQLEEIHPEIEIKYGEENSVIIDAFHKSNYLIFPSKVEGLPLVVAEAMQQGVIPITSDLPVLKIITKDCGYSFHYDDIDAFVRTIIFLENNPNQKKTLNQKAQEIR